MLSFALYRASQLILVMFVAGTVAFVLGHVVGDPLNLLAPPDIGARGQEVAKQAFIKENGLDKPLPVQFFNYVKDAARFDFGNSWQFRRPATELVWERVPATLQLAVAGLAFAVALGLVAGIASAYWRGTWFDQLISSAVLIGQATPTFVVGIVLIQIVAVQWALLPVGGREGGLDRLVLPTLTLGLGLAAPIARLTR